MVGSEEWIFWSPSLSQVTLECIFISGLNPNQYFGLSQVTLEVFWSPLECISISIFIFQALTLASEFESQNSYTWEVFEYTCTFEYT